MDHDHDDLLPEDANSYENIFAHDGETYLPFVRVQPGNAPGAFTCLLENISFLLEDAYKINDQFCIVVPTADSAGAYAKDFNDVIFFENHDGENNLDDDQVIQQREAATETLGAFLYHLRLTAMNLGYGDDILVEKAGGTKFALAFNDGRKLIYTLATLAAQNGLSDDLAPITRQGLSPAVLGLKGHFAGHVSGDISPFLKTSSLPYPFKDLLSVYSAGRQNLAAPMMSVSPLAESIPQMH